MGYFNFGMALENLKNNVKVARAGWNGRGMYIQLQRPDSSSKMTEAYIFMSTTDGRLIPWTASQADLLASDWGVAD